MPFKLKVLRKFCATGERGIDHEEVQSIKTAERLGLLAIEVQAFLLSKQICVQLSAFSLTAGADRPRDLND